MEERNVLSTGKKNRQQNKIDDNDKKSENLSIKISEMGFRLLGRFMFILVIFYLCSGISIINTDEVAMVLRFGELVEGGGANSIHQPGFLFAFPKPIDEVIRVKVKRIYEYEIKDLKRPLLANERQSGSEERTVLNSESIDPEVEGYCVTGDSNIVQVYPIIKYQIHDPVAWILRQHSPEMLLHDTIMSALVQTVGRMSIDSVLSDGKKALSLSVCEEGQRRLDAVNAGILILSLEFQEIVPPRQVMNEFKEVQNAYIDKETLKKEAMVYKEEKIREAQTAANAEINDAKAYEANVLSAARGETNAFKLLVEEYKKNPEVVRERLYRDHLEKCLSENGKTTIVPEPKDSIYNDFRIFIPGGE